MKTILYATDYSQNSVNALIMAHTMAKKLNCKLIVMHVFDDPVALAGSVSITYLKKEKKLFKEHTMRLRNFYSEHLGIPVNETDVQIEVAENDSAVAALLENAARFDADLLVIGTKGASRFKEIFLGSTTKALIKKAPCPVMAVPHTYASETIKTIIYATDFEEADIFAIKKLTAIAKPFNAAIKVVHVTNKTEYAGDQQMEWFKDMLGQKVSTENMAFEVVVSDEIFTAIYAYVLKTGADILVMLERSEKGIYHQLFHGDLVARMESKILVPLLSFNETGQ
jgi:nucleotide-binding universal stress UspA family protein